MSIDFQNNKQILISKQDIIQDYLKLTANFSKDSFSSKSCNDPKELKEIKITSPNSSSIFSYNSQNLSQNTKRENNIYSNGINEYISKENGSGYKENNNPLAKSTDLKNYCKN